MATKNSIRVKSQAEYSIEVNDAGDTISFDMTDTGLTSRLFKMYEDIESITKECEARVAALGDGPDEALHTAMLPGEDGELQERVLITKHQYETAKLLDDYYKDARGAMDVFLGHGACQKIFGDKNYTRMFDDLLGQLKPHFDKMGLKAEDIKKSAAKKHAPNRAQRRALV